jgi:hypothetical protein
MQVGFVAQDLPMEEQILSHVQESSPRMLFNIYQTISGSVKWEIAKSLLPLVVGLVKNLLVFK